MKSDKQYAKDMFGWGYCIETIADVMGWTWSYTASVVK